MWGRSSPAGTIHSKGVGKMVGSELWRQTVRVLDREEYRKVMETVRGVVFVSAIIYPSDKAREPLGFRESFFPDLRRPRTIPRAKDP